MAEPGKTDEPNLNLPSNQGEDESKTQQPQQQGPSQTHQQGPSQSYQQGPPQSYQQGPAPAYQQGPAPDYHQGQPHDQGYQQGPPQHYQYGPPPQVYYAQPGHQTTSTNVTTLITQQPPAKAPQNIRYWSSGLCGCCSDCESCCFAFWCWDCFMCSLASRLGENYCGPYCCGCPFDVAMRTKVRTMYGITGSICEDICTVAWCMSCAMCQMKRELDAMEGRGAVGHTQITSIQVHPSG